MRFELTTSTLARLHSTAELFPQKDAFGSADRPGRQAPGKRSGRARKPAERHFQGKAVRLKSSKSRRLR